MRLFRLLSVLLTVALLSACAKPLPPEQAAYAGTWSAQGVTLAIAQEGTIAYRKVDKSGGMNHSTSIDAPIKQFDADGFTVGVGPIETKFVVQHPPHKDGEVWKMTVDGVELTKSP
ncbi:hypothetical protein [Massilia sp. CF038]|uniref:hypothetical protein n=1 Tax=Massilia sp. CF038 TaxID=1881045 RepID=UPI000911E30F|nr:hypothetical protein [Massilia sp. CF038]SHG41350.1 hypothetical protein SAMN05428948_0353 [Massilia sp. CF038]